MNPLHLTLARDSAFGAAWTFGLLSVLCLNGAHVGGAYALVALTFLNVGLIRGLRHRQRRMYESDRAMARKSTAGVLRAILVFRAKRVASKSAAQDTVSLSEVANTTVWSRESETRAGKRGAA